MVSSDPEQPLQVIGDLVVHGRQDVGVGVQGDADLAVTEQLLDLLRVNVGSEQGRRATMPKITEPDVRQAGLAEQRLEDLSDEVAGLDRRAVPRREDEPVALPPGPGP